MSAEQRFIAGATWLFTFFSIPSITDITPGGAKDAEQWLAVRRFQASIEFVKLLHVLRGQLIC
jgi:hypothetical protein